MKRRELFRMIPAPPVVLAAREAAAQQRKPRATRAAAPPDHGGPVITTGGGSSYRWVFLKLLMSEPGLYGLRSASIVNDPHTVVVALENHFVPFRVGKETNRIETCGGRRTCAPIPGTAVLKGGYLYGGDGPGLGMDIDEAAAAKSPMGEPPPGDPWTIGRRVARPSLTAGADRRPAEARRPPA